MSRPVLPSDLVSHAALSLLDTNLTSSTAARVVGPALLSRDTGGDLHDLSQLYEEVGSGPLVQDTVEVATWHS